MSEASKDLYGKKLKLKKLNQMKIIFVPASIGVLSCLRVVALDEISRFTHVSSLIPSKLRKSHIRVILLFHTNTVNWLK